MYPAWRFLDTGQLTAAENMALDDIMLERRAAGTTPNTIRFLQFNPPAVLVGYHQSVEQEVRMEFCRNNGIDINRRLTGGGAIFFDEGSLGWEVIASKADLRVHQPSEGLFRRMCEGTILGLNALGIRAAFRPKNDIEIDGRKISGTGGTERDEAFLFQGTLLVDFDVEAMVRALRIPIMKLKDKEIRSVKERVTCLRWEMGYTPPITRVKEALRKGFEKALGLRLVEGGLTRAEEHLLECRLGAFQSDEWVFLDRRPLRDSPEVSAVRKTQGGLMRASLTMDKNLNTIKYALLTGDFFVFPQGAIMDLEARLKNVPLEEVDVRNIVNEFFASTQAQIIGVTPDDLIGLILEAAGKRRYESIGIELEEANRIHTINGDAMEVIANGCGALLLPYCAKLTTCKYRRKDGCTMCGDCTIGSAYKLAEEKGLKPVTIQNFEHLLAVLEGLKEDGVRGYIGCCCEAFYCKHQDDLESVGIPGILIDIDNQTCYDLGKEAEALKGTFESQTELKVDLLSKLVSNIRSKALG